MADNVGKIVAIAKAVSKVDSAIVEQQVKTETDAWLTEHITNPDSPPLDRSLSSSSSAAPADMLGDLKSAFEENIGSWYYSTTMTARYPFINIDAVYTKVYFKLIKPIVQGISGVAIYGSADNWHTQTLLYTTNATEFVAEIDPTGYTALHFVVALPESMTVEYGAIIHGFDDHSISQFVLDLNDDCADNASDIEIIENDIANIKSQQFLQNTFTDISNVMTGEDNQGYYLNASGKIVSGGTSFYITKYAVTADKIYNISGESVKLLVSGLPFAGFSTTGTISDGLQTSIVLSGSTVAQDYNVLYSPSESGYLYIAWVNGYGQLKAFSSPTVRESLQGIYSDIAVAGTKYTGFFLGSTGKIATGGSQLCITTYQVSANKKYRIIGDDVKLMGAFGLVGFATTGTVEANKQTTLIQLGSSTATDYNFTYTPTQDGYLFCAWVDSSGYTQLSVFSESPYSESVNDLLRFVQYSDTPLKVQVFGDSITDESWRSPNQSWATWIQTYIAQRQINLINSGVAGSSYGHGTISPGKYDDHPNGNKINDLLTDGTLETDADIIVMFAGTNNWAGLTPLGQWGDNTVSTFYGAVRNAFDYLAKNTSALVIVCTPCGRYNSADEERTTNADGMPLVDGKTLRDFCDAIVQTAHLYEFPVVDLYYDLGWNIYNVDNFTNDGLHPNEKGAKWISQLICGNIKTHLGI